MMPPPQLQEAAVVWAHFAILVAAQFPVGIWGGTSDVNITRVMISRATWQSPHLTGLVELPLYPTSLAPLPIVVTNSDRNLNFWFEEPGDPLNNNVTRFFFCSIDNVALEAYSTCGAMPTTGYVTLILGCNA